MPFRRFRTGVIPSRPCRAMQGESEKDMLESRSAYGYYGAAGGYTGETPPDNVIFKKMKYYEYKTKYPQCKTLGDYDKIEKTITVMLPAEYADRPNFGNRYQIREFHFVYYPMEQGVAGVILKAKNYKNALRNAKKWAKENGKTITGNAPGYEYQSKDL